MKRINKYLVVLILNGITLASWAQQKVLSLNEAIDLALQNNLSLQAENLQIEQQKALRGTAKDIPKMDFFYGFDKNNIAENGKPLHVVGLGQQFKLPGIYKLQAQLNDARVIASVKSLNASRQYISFQVSQAYQSIIYQQEKINNLSSLDSLVEKFQVSASRLLELGEGNYLQKITADAKRNSSLLQLKQASSELAVAYQELYQWVQAAEPFAIELTPLKRIPVLMTSIENHPEVDYRNQLINVAEEEFRLAEKLHLPEFNLSVFQGFNSFSDLQIYPGVEVGLVLPVWKKQFDAQRQAGEINRQLEKVELDKLSNQLAYRSEILENDLHKYLLALNQFEENDRELMNELFSTADKFYQGGEIDVLQYLQILEQATQMKMEYLENLYLYNQTVLYRNYLIL